MKTKVHINMVAVKDLSILLGLLSFLGICLCWSWAEWWFIFVLSALLLFSMIAFTAYVFWKVDFDNNKKSHLGKRSR